MGCISSTSRPTGAASSSLPTGAASSSRPLKKESPDQDYTHFISLPLAGHPELDKKLESFQRSVLGASNGEIHESIFVKPKTFHLTVLMLSLWNEERVGAATKVMRNVSSKVLDALDRRPILIRLEGLACMTGSPAKARVVYAPVKEVGGEGRLERACEIIIKAFVEAGLVVEKDAHKTLKLHATVMNAAFMRAKPGMKKKDTFDAEAIFKKHGSKEWGEHRIKEVHLSQRFAYDENRYFHCCSSIKLP